MDCGDLDSYEFIMDMCYSPEGDKWRLMLKYDYDDFDILANKPGGMSCVIDNDDGDTEYDGRGLFFGSVFNLAQECNYEDCEVEEMYVSKYDYLMINSNEDDFSFTGFDTCPN